MVKLYKFKSDDSTVDEFGVDHKGFSLRDELEYNMKRSEEKENASEKRKSNKLEGILDSALGWMLEYKTLRDAKDEMDKVNRAGYDNYAHRLAMCRIGQMGAEGAVLSPTIGLGLGVGKEALDLYNKSYKGNMPWSESLSDSWKDMKNNYEGLNFGLNNPEKNCRKWLKDLDVKNNRWRK